MGSTVGVDIGGTKMLGVLFGPDDTVLRDIRKPTGQGADGLLDSLTDLVEELVAAAGDPAEVDAVGVGIAGLVDRGGRLRRAPNLVGADEFAVGDLLAPRIGLPVAVDNDANCAARAELRLGAARGVSDGILVALGTGIGGAVIVDGRVCQGAAGMAGEVGHMVIDPHGPPCPCGGRGCWERYASGAGLAHLAQEAAAAGGLVEVTARAGGPAALRGEDVTAAARAGDREAHDILEAFAAWTALGLRNLAALLDPELIVVGGGLVTDWDLFGDSVVHRFGQVLLAADHRPPIAVVPATAGAAAGAIGAAILAAEADAEA